ncbi:SAM-dependent methyltransferase [Rhodoblastus acidophilus]|uniref:class I SAM-dependent methyltransferase n=1 Tax=Rhodoblastus acidophilus TaxID=1074 RepID=UPI0022254B13|nr:class I SAM-dependent methyltransferase [Rhodoblastus acidophilus]MCW2284512.1 SAM-dependent methyltransferase [Rhodoblastus acidophilus]MCW2333466.1 SAM-dependent methyltransferase [Rhodoblastus acidophilus]
MELARKKHTGADIKEFLKTVTLPFSDQENAMRYHDVHSQRYAITLNALGNIPFNDKMKVLELAASPYGMSAFFCQEFGENLTLATYANPESRRDVTIGVNGKCYTVEEYGFNVEKDIWPLPEESYDVVIACEVVEHLAMDPMALFAGANRILKPGGYLFISTPNSASIQNFLKLGRLQPAGIAQHFRRPFGIERLYERHNREYTPFTLGEMMSAAGFEITLMATDSSYPVNDYGFSQEDIGKIIQIIGAPELRCDTANVIGRKVSGVVNRFPTSHELYIAEDG